MESRADGSGWEAVPETVHRLGPRSVGPAASSLPGCLAGLLPPSPRGGKNQESEGHPGQRVSERERPSRAGTDGESLPSEGLEVGV